ncbi:hypothetical protein DW189_06040 [Alistipes sp. AM16-43]|nr:hypothetical protein DW189_06040 [Alistipes sp. AM16-43]BBL01152.1 hypothetical protein A3BBH6_13880 [Alistipes onderdonkii subsp. vulgaris]
MQGIPDKKYPCSIRHRQTGSDRRADCKTEQAADKRSRQDRAANARKGRTGEWTDERAGLAGGGQRTSITARPEI